MVIATVDTFQLCAKYDSKFISYSSINPSAVIVEAPNCCVR